MTSCQWIELRLKTLANYEWDVLRSVQCSRARSGFFTAFSYSFLKKLSSHRAEQLLNCCLKFQLCFSALEWSTSWLGKSLLKIHSLSAQLTAASFIYNGNFYTLAFSNAVLQQDAKYLYPIKHFFESFCRRSTGRASKEHTLYILCICCYLFWCSYIQI